MTKSGVASGDPLAGWDPRRRAALESMWERFQRAAGDTSLSDELIAERRREAAADEASIAE